MTDISCALTNFVSPSVPCVFSFCRNLMVADSWDTSVVTRLMLRYPPTSIGQRCSVMWAGLSNGATLVIRLSQNLYPMAFTCLYPFLMHHGNTLAWTSFLVSDEDICANVTPTSPPSAHIGPV